MIKTTYLILAIWIGILWVTNANAQILNIEQYRFEDDTSKLWKGNLALRYSLTENQIRTTTYGVNLNLARYHPGYRLVLISDASFTRVNDQDGINNAFAHIRFTKVATKRLAAESFGQIQTDQVRGMDRRVLAGIGARFHPIKKAKLLLTWGTGVMFEDESWAFENRDSTTTLIKSSSYISASGQLAEGISYNIISYYQARLDRLDEPRISLDAAVNFKVKKWLLFSTNFSLFYDEAPIVPIEKLIYTLNNGLTIAF